MNIDDYISKRKMQLLRFKSFWISKRIVGGDTTYPEDASFEEWDKLFDAMLEKR